MSFSAGRKSLHPIAPRPKRRAGRSEARLHPLRARDPAATNENRRPLEGAAQPEAAAGGEEGCSLAVVLAIWYRSPERQGAAPDKAQP
jgi:hypothetical protein